MGFRFLHLDGITRPPWPPKSNEMPRKAHLPKPAAYGPGQLDWPGLLEDGGLQRRRSLRLPSDFVEPDGSRRPSIGRPAPAAAGAASRCR